jgi:hypothetical protein
VVPLSKTSVIYNICFHLSWVNFILSVTSGIADIFMIPKQTFTVVSPAQIIDQWSQYNMVVL